MALGMHQRRVGRISHGCNISNIEVLSVTTLLVDPSLLLLSGDDLLSLNELLSVVDGPHDVIISGLLHHVGRCRLQTRDNLPILTLGWVNKLVLRPAVQMVILVADEAALIYLTPPTVKGGLASGVNIPWRPHGVWKLGHHLLERELKGSELGLGKLIFNLDLKVNKFRFNLWIDVSWPLEFAASQCNNVTARGPLLLNIVVVKLTSLSVVVCSLGQTI
jgi:hypothetical protein